MIPRLLGGILLWTALAGLLGAQPANLRTRLTNLQQIEIKPGLTRIPNAEGDGRDAQVFCAWRDNGNAWGFHMTSLSHATDCRRIPVRPRHSSPIVIERIR